MQIVIKKGGPPDFTPWEPTTWRRVLESPHGLPRILMLARWPKEVFDSWRVRRGERRLAKNLVSKKGVVNRLLAEGFRGDLPAFLVAEASVAKALAVDIPAHEPCDCRFCDDYRTHRRD